MTSTTIDGVTTGSPAAAPARARAAGPGALLTRVASFAVGVVEERRALRAYRSQERALSGAHGTELSDLQALARRG